jgi:ribonuclease HI
MKNSEIIIFSDGSSRGNPGPGGWGAIVATCEKVVELGGRESPTTNNRMELMGAISALRSLGGSTSKLGGIVVNTDSSYVINGITKWVHGWQKNGWKSSRDEDVVNRGLWQELIDVSTGKKIKWNYVGGHIGVPGNERADVIATSFADDEKIKLFKGKLSNYEHDLNDVIGCMVKTKKKTSKKGPAYSYLSLVNRVLKIDKTWAECEKRVKGIKGNVKFKKATSPEEEKEIIKEWRV